MGKTVGYAISKFPEAPIRDYVPEYLQKTMKLYFHSSKFFVREIDNIENNLTASYVGE